MALRSFIESLQQEQPELWQALLNAAKEGLVFIDEPNDAITATNRLLLTYPGLHDLLAFFTDQWFENTSQSQQFFRDLLKEQKALAQSS